MMTLHLYANYYSKIPVSTHKYSTHFNIQMWERHSHLDHGLKTVSLKTVTNDSKILYRKFNAMMAQNLWE